ncbi:MAG: hypothetical protein WC279_07610 [Sulfurimonas sp.]|jgi:hypothetical protein|uniref:hypothetical protein n=1 Tax=unclassified Sulfurimonas TaxID=2623549 RepID=UPI0008C3CC96|nr:MULTISPECIES: hypothetical protein [unclassified Sulfurimonas]MBS4069666.1 hypothetical protein [Sulfurimonas sp.]MDD3854906.1 hypothetical protein [Sulfurimonas sp.]OHE03612.1 MAG: hypothetical protein A2345_11025 [Sulfurimonas sp. RIFOXYB12_FULL_35_9]OHE16384.1 MAG: hypothetical protein A2540_11135 [Sulfurimonas sp. RIFOXYD2_FULL_37_8]
MKIGKVLEGIEKLFFSDINDEKKQEKLKEKLLKKIEETKIEIKNSSTDEELRDLKAKLYILKKLLERV